MRRKRLEVEEREGGIRGVRGWNWRSERVELEERESILFD